MSDPDSAFAKGLVAWYGFLQGAHMIATARASVVLLADGTLSFPAAPPPGGWSAPARYFLAGMGAVDAVNVVLSLIFVYDYFTHARWRMWLGTLTLTISVYSAVLFACGRMPSGAWAAHPLGYLSMTVVFAPIGVLFVLFGAWALRGSFHQSPGPRSRSVG